MTGRNDTGHWCDNYVTAVKKQVMKEKNSDRQQVENNPKDRNFDQEQVSGKSRSTAGREHREEQAQDDYNAQDRNFDHKEVAGDKDKE